MSVQLSTLAGSLWLTVLSTHLLAATSSERLTASNSLSPFTPPEILYYGANIGLFPAQVRHWIITEGFPVEKMEQPWALEPNLKAWWSGDGNQVLFQASYTIDSKKETATNRALVAVFYKAKHRTANNRMLSAVRACRIRKDPQSQTGSTLGIKGGFNHTVVASNTAETR
ncbi:hypothetical protein [Vibrio sp. WXL210]|uniref:hypothetical protein n=1 Tax=Vibrio sp. WXL210 TaxID=3450709 RepID=UPI003EC58D3F